MKLGVVSDTHNIPDIVIRNVMDELKNIHKVEMIIHCGDINPEHISAELFGNLPLACALVEGQEKNPIFEEKKPDNWRFTYPGKRIIELPDGTKIYLGHRIHLNFLRTSEDKFDETLTVLREQNDGLRYVFGGHLHFQTLKEGQLVTFINPGAIKDALGWGYEYAVVDTVTGEIIFGRILPTPDDRSTFSVGVISDSLDITHRDQTFWSKLATELAKRGVKDIIHCGNIDLKDIGRSELGNFNVHYAIRSDQSYLHKQLKNNEESIPSNWTMISEDKVVDINGYRFYVKLDFGLDLMSLSEHDMDAAAMKIRLQHPETTFVLCGFTRQALYVEGQQVTIINPGDVNIGRGYAVIRLPCNMITYHSVPIE